MCVLRLYICVMCVTFVHMCVYACTYVCSRIETELGYPGQPGHVLSRSSESDPVYKLSGLTWIPYWITCVNNGV